MKIKQISLFIENKPGAIGVPCKILADAGISISTLSLADSKFFGVLRMLILDWENAKNILEEKGFAVNVTDVVAISVEHTSGSLAKILSVLDENAINVEYMYAFAAGREGKAVLIFRFQDADTAIAKLTGKSNLKILNSASLFGKSEN